MNCCDYNCDQGANCPIRVNPTSRRYSRTLAEAFPRHPSPNFVEEEVGYHKALEWVLIGFLVALPILLWAL